MFDLNGVYQYMLIFTLNVPQQTYNLPLIGYDKLRYTMFYSISLFFWWWKTYVSVKNKNKIFFISNECSFMHLQVQKFYKGLEKK